MPPVNCEKISHVAKNATLKKLPQFQFKTEMHQIRFQLAGGAKALLRPLAGFNESYLGRLLIIKKRLLGPKMGSRESNWTWPIGHQEIILRQMVKTNVHIVKVICTSWSNAVNTRNILLQSTKVLLAIVYVIGPTRDVIVQ